MFDFGSNDIRYHNYSKAYLNKDNRWSQDWHQFPGLPLSVPAEDITIPFGNDIQYLFNSYWHFSIYLSIGYVIVIFGLKYLMNYRKDGFDLRKYLTIWNCILSLFSICGVIRCLPEFIHILYAKGFTDSFCNNSYYEDIRLNIWYLYFTLSKALELIDTLFIVLRKHKLINLHWIHHILTLNYSWYVFGDVPSNARWMVNMNFLIHSMMYTYYALKAMRFTIPRYVNITITSLQIAQMFAGLFINYLALYYKMSGTPCDLSPKVAIFGFSLYFLFFLLFMNFFIKTYVLKARAKKSVQKSSICSKEDINHNTCQTNLNQTNGYINGEAKKLL